MGKTTIDYVTDSWNPVVGCSHSGSPGCDNCYAARLAATRLAHHPLYRGLGEIKAGVARWTGEVRYNPKALDEPLRAKKPRRYLVCSMGDLFHQDVDAEYQGDVWQTMSETPRHRYLVLTKRPTELANWWQEYWEPAVSWDHEQAVLPNTYPGVTVESQDQMWRVEEMFKIPAAGHWVSIEPMLGPVDVEQYLYSQGPNEPQHIGFVVLGGETGPNARPPHPDWIRKVRDDCVAAGVPFFFKAWGEWGEGLRGFGHPSNIKGQVVCYEDGRVLDLRDDLPLGISSAAGMTKEGKKASGRLLDGEEWNQLPWDKVEMELVDGRKGD